MNLREVAARAIAEADSDGTPWTDMLEWEHHDYHKLADAVLAEVEPAIRADERDKVFAGLIAEAKMRRGEVFFPVEHSSDVNLLGRIVTDELYSGCSLVSYLRARKEMTND